MLKNDFIRAISDVSDFNLGQSEAALDAVITALKNSLSEGEPVKIQGFGTFSVQIRKERDFRNPSNGEIVHKPETRLPRFEASPTLKKLVNEIEEA